MKRPNPALQAATGMFLTLAILPGMVMAANRNDEVLSTNLHRFIVSRATGVTEATMSAYTNTIPGTNTTYGMVPIRGGEFVLGSTGNEPGRRSDEGPQRRVRVEPFWMGVCEVTWNEYEVFLYRARGSALAPTGYLGRTTIMEFLVMNDELRRAVMRHAGMGEIEQIARQGGMRTMYEDGIIKAMMGETTIEEVLRVTEDA